MIRPYLAVIKDSFRAAVANRVLYLLLGLTTLLLAALFPLGLQEKLASPVRKTDVADFTSLSQRLLAAGDEELSTPAGRVWSRLSDRQQERLTELFGEEAESASGGSRGAGGEVTFDRLRQLDEALEALVAELNQLLDDREFYDEQAWADYALGEEAESFLERGVDDLSDDELSRFNRILLTTAFARELQPGPPTSLELSYAVWDFPSTAIPLRKEQIPEYLDIPYLLDKFVLSLGVFVAILVTASVIPQMLEPGSLNLLLSKPINRSMLLLSKYVGACAFTIIFSAYLFVGLWLFFGTRLQIWEPAFLYCIPLYVLVFAIYYAVTALAGVIFRNTIMAVVCSILFWLLCFVVGLLHGFFYGIVQTYEIREIAVMQDEVLQLDRKNVPVAWDAEQQRWSKDALVTEFNQQYTQMVHMVSADEFRLPPPLGPIAAPEQDRFYMAQASMIESGGPFAANWQLGIVGNEGGSWEYTEAFAVPGLAVNLFRELDGDLIAVTRLGSVWRLKGDPVDLMNEFSTKLQAAGAGDAEQGVDEASGAEGEPEEVVDLELFEEVGPSPPLDYSAPAEVALNPETGELLCISRGSIEIVRPNAEGRYERPENYALTLPGPKELSSQVWFAGDFIMIARGNGEIFRIQRSTMEVLDAFEPESRAAVRAITGTRDGRWFAVLFSNGQLWLGDNESSDSKMVRAPIGGQGDISAVTFDDAGQLWVADRVDRVRAYEVDSGEMIESRTPELGVAGILYRYLLIPVYTVCPKPGEFYRLVTYLTAEEEAADDVERRDAQRRDPWEPLWNGLIFIAVMLVIGCFYFQRQDF